MTLIKFGLPENGERTNKHGFALEKSEQSRVVFGNKKPVWQSEFFKAQQIGINIEFKFDMHLVDYDGEELVEFSGKRYKILRMEESKNGEIIELTLSDLSERSDLAGDI